MNKRSVGSIYEQLAAEQLINMGYSVLACNYRNRFGEIDIIAKDGDTICFCEVKYRRDNGCGRANVNQSSRKEDGRGSKGKRKRC